MDDIKTLFGKKVKELRIKKKMSQEELAEKIDIAKRNLSKIECGKSFIRAEKIGKLVNWQKFPLFRQKTYLILSIKEILIPFVMN